MKLTQTNGRIPSLRLFTPTIFLQIFLLLTSLVQFKSYSMESNDGTGPYATLLSLPKDVKNYLFNEFLFSNNDFMNVTSSCKDLLDLDNSKKKRDELVLNAVLKIYSMVHDTYLLPKQYKLTIDNFEKAIIDVGQRPSNVFSANLYIDNYLPWILKMYARSINMDWLTSGLKEKDANTKMVNLLKLLKFLRGKGIYVSNLMPNHINGQVVLSDEQRDQGVFFEILSSLANYSNYDLLSNQTSKDGNLYKSIWSDYSTKCFFLGMQDLVDEIYAQKLMLTMKTKNLLYNLFKKNLGTIINGHKLCEHANFRFELYTTKVVDETKIINFEKSAWDGGYRYRYHIVLLNKLINLLDERIIEAKNDFVNVNSNYVKSKENNEQVVVHQRVQSNFSLESQYNIFELTPPNSMQSNIVFKMDILPGVEVSSIGNNELFPLNSRKTLIVSSGNGMLKIWSKDASKFISEFILSPGLSLTVNEGQEFSVYSDKNENRKKLEIIIFY